MCGIFATANPNDKSSDVITGLSKLLSRGADSWGIGSFSFNTHVHKYTGNDVHNDAELFTLQNSNYPIVGHTRWASVGSLIYDNIQPILRDDILLVHNGTLNPVIGDLLDSYHSDTYQLVRFLKINKWTNANCRHHELLKNYIKHNFDGTAAIVVSIKQEPKTLIYYCKGSPLYYWDGRFASSLEALPNCEGIMLPDDSCGFYDSKWDGLVINGAVISDKRQLELKIQNSNQNTTTIGTTMLSEIQEQASLKYDYNDIFDFKKDELIDLVGCGSSYNAALLGKYYFKLAGYENVNAYYSTEYELKNNFQSKSHRIFITQSGETLDTLEPLRKCYPEHRIVITNTESSTAANLGPKFNILTLKVGQEKSVAATKTFIGTCLRLLSLARPSYYEDINLNGFRKDINYCVINLLEPISQIAKTLHTFKYHLVMGSGFDYPIAKEISLKLREVARINSEGLVCENFKHGSCALTSPDFCGIVLVPDNYDKKYERALNCIKQIKARNGYVIGIGPSEITECDVFIKTPAANKVLQPLLKVVVGQLLSYFSAVQQGFPTEQLVNCAKAITVH